MKLTAFSPQFTTNYQLTATRCKLPIESLLNAVSCKLKAAVGGVYG